MTVMSPTLLDEFFPQMSLEFALSFPVHQRAPDIYLFAWKHHLRPEVGTEMVRLLESWLFYQDSNVRNIQFLAWMLEGRGTQVRRYLEQSNEIFSNLILRRILDYADRYYLRNFMAIVYNAPLRIIKREMLGHE